MPKILKKLFVGLIVCMFLVSGIVYFAFKIITSPQRLENSFKQTISTTLNRDVSIGSAQLKFGRLVLKDLRVSFRKDEKINKIYDHYIVCERVKIKFRIIPLLKKKLIFKKIELKNPEIKINHIPKIQLDELFKKKMSTLFIGKGIYFEIDAMEIDKGKIDFILEDHPEINTSDVEFNIKTIVDGLVEVKVKCDLDKYGKSEVELSGIVDIFKNRADLKILKINGFGGEVEVQGQIEEVLTDPRLDLVYNFKSIPWEIVPEKVDIDGFPTLRGKIEERLKEFNLSWDMDLSLCEVECGNLYYKPSGERLRFRGGIMRRPVSYNINWYVFELPKSASVSGTGAIRSLKDISLNIVGEAIKVKYLKDRVIPISKYVEVGNINFRGKLIKSDNLFYVKAKPVISGLKIKNIRELKKLYRKITGKKKEMFKLEDVEMDIYLDNKEIKLNKLEAKGGDIEGRGKGYYRWNKEINFTLYPRIYGKEIGLRIYGNTENVKVGLK